MSIVIFATVGGQVEVPDNTLVLVDRRDGGNLIVTPPRTVWDRSELSPRELTLWSFLVAASARAMLDTLATLEGGCINYWDAGNWALNEGAIPHGPKRGEEHRSVHLHLLGRSRSATDPSWRWGEAPMFPSFADRHQWASTHERLTPAECFAVVNRIESLLTERYQMDPAAKSPRIRCEGCGYPTVADSGRRCRECELRAEPLSVRQS